MCPIKGRNEAFQGIASEKRFRLDITELLLTSVKHTNCGKEKKLTGLILLLFSFIFLFLNIKQGFCAVRMLVPSSVLSLPPGAYAVLVDKASQHLFLLLYGKGRLKVVKKVICATGEKEGDKKKAGDKRTPVGIYFCKGLLLPPRLGAQYGICALPLNYPNLIDRRHQRDGSGIWIHGIHENRPVKSTQGCVVLQNGDLAFLAVPGTRKVNHIGIVVGEDTEGEILVTHCTASTNNVVISTAESVGFMYYRQPAVLIE